MLVLDRVVTRRRYVAFAVLVVCASSAVLATTPALGAWLPLVDVSGSGGAAMHTHVAVNAQGDAVEVWQATGEYDIVWAAASAGAPGQWQTPVELTGAAENSNRPSVAIDAKGDAIVAWEHDGAVQASVHSASTGAWQTPFDISTRTPAKQCNESALEPQVAVDPKGDAVAVWQLCITHSEGEVITQVAVRPAGSGDWQAPVTISGSERMAEVPHVAIDAEGNAVVVWRGEEHVVASTGSALSGVWQAPVTISSSDAAVPTVALDAQGDAFAGWVLGTEDPKSGEREKVFQAAERPAASGVWQAPVTLSVSTLDPQDEEPGLAVDRRGDAVAVWGTETGGGIQGALRPASTGVWGAAKDLSPVNAEAYLAKVAIDRQGNAMATWATPSALESSRSAAGSGLWEKRVVIADTLFRETPSIAFDQLGNALAVWGTPIPYVGSSYYQNPNPPVVTSPAVTMVSPESGPAAGGTRVTIAGSNFTEVSSVTFGVTDATSFTVNSEDSITAVAPAGTGTVSVTVTTEAGSSAASPADQFTYIAPPDRGHRHDEHYRRFDMRRWFWH